VAEPIDWLELELRIALLPPISRAAHLGGPVLHARRLVQLWRGGKMTNREIAEVSDEELIARRIAIGDGAEAEAINAELASHSRRLPTVADSYPASEPPERPRPSDCADYWNGDDVPLSQAFRLLPVAVVARAILRTAVMSDHDYPNDPVHWPLPTLDDLLPELEDAVWQALLSGELQVDATRYARGKLSEISRPVSLIELQRLSPDWRLSRLCRDGEDEFVQARARRARAEQIKPNQPSKAEVKAAILEIAQTYSPDAHPPFKEIETALKARFAGVTQKQARDALKHAPQLRGRRGYRGTRKSSG
jgi:hypothetical protein